MSPTQFACGASSLPGILSIDDDPNFRQSLKRLFSRYRVRLLQSSQGMHVVSRVTAESPDLIITDLKPPQGRGHDVVTCLRKDARTSHIPIVVLTGIHDEVLKRHMLELGVEDYLTKPVRFEQLRETVERLIELRELGAERDTAGPKRERFLAAAGT